MTGLDLMLHGTRMTLLEPAMLERGAAGGGDPYRILDTASSKKPKSLLKHDRWIWISPTSQTVSWGTIILFL